MLLSGYELLQEKRILNITAEYTQNQSVNLHLIARVSILCLLVSQDLYVMCANSKGSDQTALMCRLVGVVVVYMAKKYLFDCCISYH